MIYLYIALLVFACALLLGALSLLVWVGYKFLLAIHIDLNVLRECSLHPILKTDSPGLSYQSAASRQTPTDGDFVFNTDEELAVAEEVRRAKAEMGQMSEADEKELAAQIRQGGVTYKG
jgi:hypothetical protein